MRVSTRGRYALRAMVDLAQHIGDKPVARQELAMRQAISADYVAQLLRRLTAAGLVRGVKGPGGGYVLARDAAAIRVIEVVQAVEGPIAVVDCVIPCQKPDCTRADCCPTRSLWKELSETIVEFLDSVTLQDLCNRAQ